MVLKLHQISHYCHKRRIPIVPRVLKGIIYVVFGCVIPPECEIGAGTRFWHSGLGVVLHPNARIGKNCNIYNHVVVGGGHDGPDGPPIEIVIGDNVSIYSGAKVVCKGTRLVVGTDSSVAANAVVLEDVPVGVIVGGIPARILKRKEKLQIV